MIDYYTQEFRNPKTGQRVYAAFPDGLKDDVIYDASVKVLAYLLNNGYNVSIDQTRRTAYSISRGMPRSNGK